MKKNTLPYPVHKDFEYMARFSPGPILLNPLVLNMSNTAARLSRTMFRTPDGVTRSRQVIPAWQGAPVELTIYRPAAATGTLPCLLYFHGGAFVMDDFNYLHEMTAAYALKSRCVVVMVRYRLAHRHPFPAGLEDCYHSLLWVHEHGAHLGIDPDCIAVGGDSAGGCLAAAVTHLSRDRQGPRLCFQFLVYPVTDASGSCTTAREFTDVPGWNANLNRKMWQIYLMDGDQGLMNYASPLQSPSFHNLPPAYVEVQEFDCLRDEGIAYARKLQSGGSEVQLVQNEGTFHGFDILQKSSFVQEIMQNRIRALSNAWGKNSRPS